MLYTRNSSIIKRSIADQCLLIPQEPVRNEQGTQQIFQLNETGECIWDALSGPKTQNDIVAIILASFSERDPEAVANEVNGFLQALVEKCLIVRMDDRP